MAPRDGLLRSVSLPLGALFAALTAAYTGWLFGQAKGRVLWMRRGLWLHLVVQACVAGFGFVALVQPWIGLGKDVTDRSSAFLLAALAAHAIFVATEPLAAPRGREREFHRASRLITRGPLAARHWFLGAGTGIVVPAILLVSTDSASMASFAGVLALVGLYVEEDVLVRAGQASPIS
jgi:Ni/Fe-hydrogenase subunit HybB-like protein